MSAPPGSSEPHFWTASYAAGVGSRENAAAELRSILPRKTPSSTHDQVVEMRQGRVYFTLEDGEEHQFEQMLPRLTFAERVGFVLGRETDAEWIRSQKDSPDKILWWVQTRLAAAATSEAIQIWKEAHRGKEPETFRVSCRKSKHVTGGNKSTTPGSAQRSDFQADAVGGGGEGEGDHPRGPAEAGAPLVQELALFSSMDYCRKAAGLVLDRFSDELRPQMERPDLDFTLLLNEEEFLFYLPIYAAAPGSAGHARRRMHVHGLSAAVCFAMCRSVIYDFFGDEQDDEEDELTILDPMCGRGSLLFEALDVARGGCGGGSARASRPVKLVGIDQDADQLAACVLNAASLNCPVAIQDCGTTSASEQARQGQGLELFLSDKISTLRKKHGLAAATSAAPSSSSSDLSVPNAVGDEPAGGARVLTSKETATRTTATTSAATTSLQLSYGKFREKLADLLAPHSVDVVVCDLPFNRQFETNKSTLYPEVTGLLKTYLKVGTENVLAEDGGRGAVGLGGEGGRFALLVQMEDADALCEALAVEGSDGENEDPLFRTGKLQHGCRSTASTKVQLYVTERRRVHLGPHTEGCIVVGGAWTAAHNYTQKATPPAVTNRLRWERKAGRADWLREKMSAAKQGGCIRLLQPVALANDSADAEPCPVV